MNEKELRHHGVKGMHWGVRRYQNYDGSLIGAAGKAKLSSTDKKKQKQQKAFEKKYNKTWTKSYNKATKQFNKELETINKKYDTEKFDWNDDYMTYTDEKGKEYLHELNKTWKGIYTEQLLKDYGEDVINGKDWVKNAYFMNTYDEFEYNHDLYKFDQSRRGNTK